MTKEQCIKLRESCVDIISLLRLRKEDENRLTRKLMISLALRELDFLFDGLTHFIES